MDEEHIVPTSGYVTMNPDDLESSLEGDLEWDNMCRVQSDEEYERGDLVMPTMEDIKNQLPNMITAIMCSSGIKMSKGYDLQSFAEQLSTVMGQHCSMDDFAKCMCGETASRADLMREAEKLGLIEIKENKYYPIFKNESLKEFAEATVRGAQMAEQKKLMDLNNKQTRVKDPKVQLVLLNAANFLIDLMTKCLDEARKNRQEDFVKYQHLIDLFDKVKTRQVDDYLLQRYSVLQINPDEHFSNFINRVTTRSSLKAATDMIELRAIEPVPGDGNRFTLMEGFKKHSEEYIEIVVGKEVKEKQKQDERKARIDAEADERRRKNSEERFRENLSTLERSKNNFGVASFGPNQPPKPPKRRERSNSPVEEMQQKLNRGFYDVSSEDTDDVDLETDGIYSDEEKNHEKKEKKKKTKPSTSKPKSSSSVTKSSQAMQSFGMSKGFGGTSFSRKTSIDEEEEEEDEVKTVRQESVKEKGRTTPVKKKSVRERSPPTSDDEMPKSVPVNTYNIKYNKKSDRVLEPSAVNSAPRQDEMEERHHRRRSPPKGPPPSVPKESTSELPNDDMFRRKKEMIEREELERMTRNDELYARRAQDEEDEAERRYIAHCKSNSGSAARYQPQDPILNPYNRHQMPIPSFPLQQHVPATPSTVFGSQSYQTAHGSFAPSVVSSQLTDPVQHLLPQQARHQLPHEINQPFQQPPSIQSHHSGVPHSAPAWNQQQPGLDPFFLQHRPMAPSAMANGMESNHQQHSGLDAYFQQQHRPITHNAMANGMESVHDEMFFDTYGSSAASVQFNTERPMGIPQRPSPEYFSQQQQYQPPPSSFSSFGQSRQSRARSTNSMYPESTFSRPSIFNPHPNIMASEVKMEIDRVVAMNRGRNIFQTPLDEFLPNLARYQSFFQTTCGDVERFINTECTHLVITSDGLRKWVMQRPNM